MIAVDDLGASSDATDGSFIVDNVAPHHWRDFTPTGWVADQTPDCTIEAADNTAGLDVSTACYKYSNDGGSSWSGWRPASCTGSDGTTSYQTITAGSVPFNQDSGTQNMIKFRIDDTATNPGESDEYTVWVDAADHPTPVVSSSTHPDGGVGATGAVTLRGVCSKLWFSRYPKPEAVSTRLKSTTPPKSRQHHMARQPRATEIVKYDQCV